MLASRVSSTLQQLRKWAAVLLVSVGGFELTAWLAPYSPPAPLVAYVFGFACVVASALAVALFVPKERRALVAGSGVACLLMLTAVLAPSEKTTGYPPLCVLAGLLMLGTAIGAVIGRGIQDPSHLLFVALVSGVADVLSVMQPGGISKAIAEQPRALALLALPWPLLGVDDVAPFLGVSDVVFASLYVHATRTHDLPLVRSVLALAAAFAATAALVLIFQRPIPVLPLLGASIVLAQPRARAASAADLRRGAWVLAALAVVIATVFLRRSP